MKSFGICSVCEVEYGYIRKIDAGNLSIDDSFTIATSCSKLLSSGNPNDEMTARTIVIHILNTWAQIPADTYPIWTDINRSDRILSLS